MTPAHIITEDSVTVVIDGESYTVRKSSRNFDAAREAAFLNQWDRIPELATPGLAIEQWLDRSFTLKEGLLYYKGEEVDASLSERLQKMAAAGNDPSGWLKFWERLQRNPSWRSVQQLYSFLAHSGIPIDESTGHILAYKSVRRDYLDHHSGQFDNSPGAHLEMPRNRISDDPNVACHEGFHVGSLGYAQGFGSTDKRLVVVSVDPADVVCVPYDAGAGKMRVCRYQVVGNYSGEPLPDTSVKDEGGEDYDDHDEHSYYEDDEDEDSIDDLSDDELDEELRRAGMDPGKAVARVLSDVLVATTKATEEQQGPADEASETDQGESPIGEWDDLNVMNPQELAEQPLSILRRYARFGLEIFRASKLPGGKAALVKRILEVRNT